MGTQKQIRVKYILNPGDGQDVEIFVGTVATPKNIATNVLNQVMPRWEDARAANPLATLHRVTYAGRRKIVEEYDHRAETWSELEREEFDHLIIKVLEHVR